MLAASGTCDLPRNPFARLRTRETMHLAGRQRVRDTLSGQREEQVAFALFIFVHDIDVGRHRGANLQREFVARGNLGSLLHTNSDAAALDVQGSLDSVFARGLAGSD